MRSPFATVHPSTLHLWARRPLAACRAVLFGQLVDDPSSWPDRFPTEGAQDRERQRIFRIIEDLVKWENSTNETVLNAARWEIAFSLARGRVADGGNERDQEVFGLADNAAILSTTRLGANHFSRGGGCRSSLTRVA